MDGSGRNFLGRFIGGKASPSSFSVTIASRVWRLLSKNAVNRGFLRFSKSMKCCQVLATKGCDKFFVIKKRVGGNGH